MNVQRMVFFMVGFLIGWFQRRAIETANDPKLSDGGGWRGPCMAGGKAAAEARAVTAVAVRCSAWLGVAVIGRIGRREVRCNRPKSPRRSATTHRTRRTENQNRRRR